jgi:hypothetical protein
MGISVSRKQWGQPILPPLSLLLIKKTMIQELNDLLLSIRH